MRSSLDILKKHSRMAPRYTSYPSAARFEPISVKEHEDMLKGTDPNRPYSLYFHVPFCKNVCYFCGCSVVYTRNQGRCKPYLEQLLKEIELVRSNLPAGAQVDQIHFGGGTPNFFRPEQLAEIHNKVAELFEIVPDAEKSIELDPRTVETGHIQTLADLGFNRVSLGIQDMNEEVQKAVNRIQSAELVDGIVKQLRARKVAINFDLIYGLPHQTVQSVHDTLDKVITWTPDRIAMFHFAFIPELKVHQRRICADDLPDAAEKLDIFEQASIHLRRAGYGSIGLDHFALPTDTLYTSLVEGTLRRNFQGYTTGQGQLVGFGATSISDFDSGYAQNQKKLEEYAAAVLAGRLPTERGLHMSDDDKIRRRIIMQIMTYMRLSKSAVAKAEGLVFEDYFRPEIEAMRELADDGLVFMSDDEIIVREVARPFLRNIAMTFDVHAGHIKTPMSQAV